MVTWLQINAMFPVGHQVKNYYMLPQAMKIHEQKSGETHKFINKNFPIFYWNRESKKEENTQ